MNNQDQLRKEIEGELENFGFYQDTKTGKEFAKRLFTLFNKEQEDTALTIRCAITDIRVADFSGAINRLKKLHDELKERSE